MNNIDLLFLFLVTFGLAFIFFTGLIGTYGAIIAGMYWQAAIFVVFMTIVFLFWRKTVKWTKLTS